MILLLIPSIFPLFFSQNPNSLSPSSFHFLSPHHFICTMLSPVSAGGATPSSLLLASAISNFDHHTFRFPLSMFSFLPLSFLCLSLPSSSGLKYVNRPHQGRFQTILTFNCLGLNFSLHLSVCACVARLSCFRSMLLLSLPPCCEATQETGQGSNRGTASKDPL